MATLRKREPVDTKPELFLPELRNSGNDDPVPYIADRGGCQIRGDLFTACERLPSGSDNEVVVCLPGELAPSADWKIGYRGRLLDGSYQVWNLRDTMYSLGELLLANMFYSRIIREWPEAVKYLRRRGARGSVRVSHIFPSDQSIYRAVHKEQAYLSNKNGELIPYTDADSIKAM
jgi:hypothetical protein